jgi:hypothetical protein
LIVEAVSKTEILEPPQSKELTPIPWVGSCLLTIIKIELIITKLELLGVFLWNFVDLAAMSR